MDSGCLAPGESLDEDYDVNRSLLPEEVLGIIDQLLCHEVCALRPELRAGLLTPDGCRWPGTWGILYLKHSSPVSISRASLCLCP